MLLLGNASSLHEVIDFSTGLIAGKLQALGSFFRESECIVLAARLLAFGVGAEIKRDLTAHVVLDLPVAVLVPQLLKVEQSLLSKFVAGIGLGVLLVPAGVVLIVLICIVYFLGWLGRLRRMISLLSRCSVMSRLSALPLRLRLAHWLRLEHRLACRCA